MVEILMEEQYMNEEEVYKDFCDNASDMMQSVTAEARFRYVNNSWLKTLGYKKQEITGMTLFDIVHPDELEHCRELFRRVMSGENVGLVNTTFVTKGGAEVLVEGNVSCEIVDGKPTYTRAIFRDITEHKQAQEALQESKEKMHSLLNSMDDLVFVIAMDGTFKDYYQSSNREDLYVPQSEFIGKHFKDVLPSDVTESLRATIKAVETSGKSQKFDYVLEITGEKFWYEAQISPVRDRSGVVTAVTAVSRNITERNRVVHDLRERIKELNCLYSIVSIAKKPDVKLDEICREVVSLLPLSWQYPEITCARITISGKEFKTENYRDTEWKQSSDIELYEAKVGEVEIRYLEERPERDEGPFLKEEKLLLNTIAKHLAEITGRKQADEKVQELYQKETVLRKELQVEIDKRIEFTRTLVHELKTPLTPMIAASDLLLEEIPEGPLFRLARSINQGANTLSSRIDALLDVAKGEMNILKLDRTETDLLHLLHRVAQDTTPLADSRNQVLDVELPRSLPKVSADGERLRQVVVNLLDNSFKFTPEGGKITIRAKTKDNAIIVEVEDTGNGIPLDQQRDLFQADYYTEGKSEHGRGLGLGLTLSRMLVELHGGKIWVESQEGKGSKFGFSLPLNNSAS